MDQTDRYYLQLIDGKWQLTHQIAVDEQTFQQMQQATQQTEVPVEVAPPPQVWTDDLTQGTYATYQEALEQAVDGPICMDPQPDWPEELGGAIRGT